LVDGLAVRARRRDLEPHLDRPAVEPARDAEARVLEDAEHGAVVRHHLGDERLDAEAGRDAGELFEQPRAGAVALELVRDREGDLGRGRIAKPRVARERDRALLVTLAERAEQRAALLPVGGEERVDERLRERREAVEAQVDAPLGQTAEEREQEPGVVRAGSSQAERAAVAKDDVPRPLQKCRTHASVASCTRTCTCTRSGTSSAIETKQPFSAA